MFIELYILKHYSLREFFNSHGQGLFVLLGDVRLKPLNENLNVFHGYQPSALSWVRKSLKYLIALYYKLITILYPPQFFGSIIVPRGAQSFLPVTTVSFLHC
jgi:hypothetical protein